MRYDCRKDGADPTARRFPCPVKILCATTGERIPNVFFLDTAPEGPNPSLGRFVVDAEGRPLASSTRRKRFVTDETGRRRLVVEYGRLERWERRPWVAVALDTGEVIARSEGVP
jgi:hypothetical protein